MRKLIILAMLFSGMAAADYKATGTAEFIAVGSPSFLKINGVGGVVGCTLKGDKFVTGECKVFMKYLKTGMELRDKHMKEKYLLTETYEYSKLTLDKFEVKEGDQSFSGILKIKKDSARFTGQANLTKHKESWKATLSGEVNIKDYPSIGVPSYLGITVADKVEVKIELEAK